MDLPFDLEGCPWTAIEQSIFALYNQFRTWASLGLLPFEGSIGEQPAYIVEAFELCSSVRKEAENKRRVDEITAMHNATIQALQPRGT